MSEFQSELNVLYNKYLLQLFMNTELFKKRFPISALRLSVANLSLFIIRYTCLARPRRRLRPCSDHTIRNLCRIGHNLLPAHSYTLCLDSRNPYYTYTHTAQIRTRHSHSCLRQNSSRRHRSIDPLRTCGRVSDWLIDSCSTSSQSGRLVVISPLSASQP
jgi:hypothetical protein